MKKFLIFLALVLVACQPTAPVAEPVQDKIDSVKVESFGEYTLRSFSYGDDECYVATDDNSVRIDVVALQCRFGESFSQTGSDIVRLGSIGEYTLSSLSNGDDECYVATDDNSVSIDAVALQCRFGENNTTNTSFTVGEYTVSYFVNGDNECYIAIDDNSVRVDAVALECRLEK